jgi:two-component system, NtrC family, sensor kinase
VYGYKNEILQVLLIIIKNAKDELTKESSTQRKLIFVDSYREENHNIIKIRDNAGGISKDIINKIFDPYFTTKENDEGTGIGLYMSKQIIEGMDGSIDVFNVNYVYEEVEYLGAEFIIKLNLDNEDKVISDNDIR